MSKIRELLKDENSVLAFDIDGVLAVMEWGEYHHFELDDEEWNRICGKGENGYTEDKVVKKMQSFLADRDMSRIYVITMVGQENEILFKKEFANKYYNIPKENVYCVNDNYEKKNILTKIKEKYPELEDYQLVMIDDTVKILNDVKTHTGFSTAHVSSFLDI